MCVKCKPSVLVEEPEFLVLVTGSRSRMVRVRGCVSAEQAGQVAEEQGWGSWAMSRRVARVAPWPVIYAPGT